MILKNKTASFSHEFFDLYTEQLKEYERIPPRKLSFFDMNKLSKKYLRILHEVLIDVLFKPGCPYYQVENVFAIKSDISKQFIAEFRKFFLNFMVL